jgi:serine/threonine protein kinase
MSEARILSLFESPGKVETATPGATVWLARDPVSGRPALLKKLPDARRRQRVTAALGLRHPAIVPTRRWLLEGGALYVVRDVPRGKNLRQILGLHKPEPEALRKYVVPVLDALEAAHLQGGTHGGVSLENVLVIEGGQTLLCDFGTTDPSDPRHRPHYAGNASVEGDIRAVARLIADLLPASGTFSQPAVRARIEGIVLRCDSLSDLREALAALDRLAAAPLPRPAPKQVAPQPSRPPGPPPLSSYDLSEEQRPVSPSGIPRLAAAMNRPDPVFAGGGGLASLDIRNDGDAVLIIRMVATQHAWLSVRPTALPITLPPGASTRIGFLIHAARLSPGEYRSEVFLSTNAAGDGAEDLRGGWFKHTFELRAAVLPPVTPRR